MAQFEPFVCTDADQPSDCLPQERQKNEGWPVLALFMLFIYLFVESADTHAHISTYFDRCEDFERPTITTHPPRPYPYS